ncbi:MAG: phospholipase D-like domain-containing protein, partial [Pseudobdellovibrionaceae bacterium]
MTLRLRRYLKIGILSALGLVLSLYGILALGLVVMEKVVEQNVQDESAVLAHSKEPHRLLLLDSGLASFQRRLDLIQNAKRSIELEFFIFDIDEASRLITQALLKKAEEGVAVRIMVGFSMPVFQLRPVYTQLMQERGVQVRYYNTSATYRII